MAGRERAEARRSVVGKDRSIRRAASGEHVLAAIVEMVAGLRADLNVTHWELFTLSDADSGSDDVFAQFGILRDDYTPKAAHQVLRELIRASAR